MNKSHCPQRDHILPGSRRQNRNLNPMIFVAIPCRWWWRDVRAVGAVGVEVVRRAKQKWPLSRYLKKRSLTSRQGRRKTRWEPSEGKGLEVTSLRDWSCFHTASLGYPRERSTKPKKVSEWIWNREGPYMLGERVLSGKKLDLSVTQCQITWFILSLMLEQQVN